MGSNLMTVLNCGRELGEVVDMGMLGEDLQVVVGEHNETAYGLEENRVAETVSCERSDDGLVVEHWEEVDDEAKRAILMNHDNVTIGQSEVKELIE